MKYYILFLAVIINIIAVFSNKEKIALGVIVFTLPFDANPFKDDFFFIGLNGILIWSFWISYSIKNRNKEEKDHSISGVIKFIYFFLVAGIILAVLNNNAGIQTSTEAGELSQVMNVSLYLISLIFFLKILLIYKDDPDYLYKLMFIFITTSFIQLLAIVSPLLGFSSLLPAFLVSNPVMFYDEQIQMIVSRSPGLISDYEILIDYAMMVIVFSLIIMVQGKRLIPSLAILSAVIIGITSGTRSFVVALVLLFFISYGYYFARFNLKQLFKIALILVISVIIVMQFFSNFIESTELFYRFSYAWSLFTSGNVAESTNRSALLTNFNVFENVGIFGRGSLFFFDILGNEMVCHNLFLAIYAKYGIIGIISIFILLGYTITFLYRGFRKAKEKKDKIEAILLFILFVVLFMQSMKVSPLRYLTSILLHSYMYMMIYFFYLKMNKETPDVLAAGQNVIENV